MSLGMLEEHNYYRHNLKMSCVILPFGVLNCMSWVVFLCPYECCGNSVSYRTVPANLFEGTCPNCLYTFQAFLLCADGNFEMQNKVLEPSIIIINCCIIISNAYYNGIINSRYNCYISNKCLLGECNKEENLEVTGAATASCLKRRL